MRLEIALTVLILLWAGLTFRSLAIYWIEDVCGLTVQPGVYFKFVGLCICAAFVVNALFTNAIDQILFLVYVVLLIMLSLIDSETTYIPDVLVMPMIAIGVFGNVAGGFYNSEIFKSGTFSMVSAAAGYGVFWLANQLYKICANGQQGIGMGDAKLMAALCSVMGISSFPFVSFVAACSFLVSHAILGAMKNKSQSTEQAFGPHISLGACIYFYGDFVVWPNYFNDKLLGLFHL